MEKRCLFIFFIFSGLTFNLFAKAIHINFKDLQIAQLIEITSRTINTNILSTTVPQGKVNFSSKKVLNEKQLLEILQFTLESHGFTLKKEKSIYRIIKNDAVSTQIVELKNSNASEVIKLLENINHIKDKVQISLIKDINSLLLVGQKKHITQVKMMIKQLDIYRLQVYVKARIIEVNNQKVNNVGIRYGIFKSKSSSSELFAFSSNLNGLNSAVNLISNSNLSLPLPTAGSALALGASINLLKQNHALDVVSEPSILCLNNKESSIYVGETKSIKTASSVTDGGTSRDTFVREDIGLTLKVKPRVSSDNKVLLELNTTLENFSQTNVTNNQPDTFKKEINTTAIVNNGESVIIGGLIEDKKENVNNDVPFLSDVPLLGNLFKDNNNINSRKNLVIIITPYIISKYSNLTKLRDKLAKLKLLEDQYLDETLHKIKKETTKQTIAKKSEPQDTKTLHQQRLKEYFGI